MKSLYSNILNVSLLELFHSLKQGDRILNLRLGIELCIRHSYLLLLLFVDCLTSIQHFRYLYIPLFNLYFRITNT